MDAKVIVMPGAVMAVRPEPSVTDVLAPDPDVVSFLEHLLAKAKSGEIRGVGAAWVRPDGMTAHNWAGAPETCVTLLIGGLMFLVHEITCAAGATSVQDPWEPSEGA